MFTQVLPKEITALPGRHVRVSLQTTTLPCSHSSTDFEVVDSLPNVTWTLPRNWAGNIPVQRDSQPNDTLFLCVLHLIPIIRVKIYLIFSWAFEKEEGSLTANASERLDEPWGIWLNG